MALLKHPEGLSTGDLVRAVNYRHSTIQVYLRRRPWRGGAPHYEGDPTAGPSLCEQGVVITSKKSAPLKEGTCRHNNNPDKQVPIGRRGKPSTIFKLSDWARKDLEALRRLEARNLVYHENMPRAKPGRPPVIYDLIERKGMTKT
jgi:hypothetical protein